MPQGSVLDPLLFTVFTNDLRKAVVEFVVDIYADPTTNKCIGCLKMGTKWDTTKGYITRGYWPSHQVDLREQDDSINAAKTKTMLVTGKRLAGNLTDQKPNILVQREKVEDANSQKLLGSKFY